MNAFIIPYGMNLMSTLKAQFCLSFNISFAWIAIMMKMWEDMRIEGQMMLYRENRGALPYAS